MDVMKLVRMANQIAANFDYGDDRQKAIDGVEDHLARFWTPAMKRQIIEYQRQDNNALVDIAALAVARLGERIGDPA